MTDSTGRIAITGAAGSLAGDLIGGLQRDGYSIVGIDQRTPADACAAEWFECSITDRDALAIALEGCDAVIHLAGIPLETEWGDLLRTNIDGTQAVLEMARQAGIRRVVLASSIHSAGYVEVPDDGKVDDDVVVRPDTFYGVSKAAVEALGSLYHYRHGMDIFCLRIAGRFQRPHDERMLSAWLSPADALRLFTACLTTSNGGFHTIWGVSANTRNYLSGDGGEAIGFFPRDNAEDYADAVLDPDQEGGPTLASQWDRQYLGGDFCSPNPPRLKSRSA
ncbi:NAD-dependent epimerase/dehydratase family protein [Arthrobacter castelli]|uniref:NAD-dependent epimerase/dehydratase family protein n=1 Tax=Arthrobacter castelli TaxID=271431 RepID=UPI00040C1B94|nr:NAD(P)-dependent oxidoreductase [Arthrobacter castelli]